MNKYEITDMILEEARKILKKQKENVSPKEFDILQAQFDQTMMIANKLIKLK